MSFAGTSVADNAGDRSNNRTEARGYNRGSVLLVVILSVASLVRLFHLGQSSFWYDEVVTMRLAQTESPTALLRLLRQIDATRAPVHPLLLQGWVTLFGPSECSGRAFSVLCGVITVGLVYWIGRQAFDLTTALWASWFCALSPLLVYYSREVRMYMWLALLTCLAWGLLFSHARTPGRWRLGFYGLCLVAVGYSHPLGLLMIGALGLASFLNQRVFQISLWEWLHVHLIVILALVPWVAQYLDHAPESTSGPLPLRYLFGMPIGFIGGNSVVLLVCIILIIYGLFGTRHERNSSQPLLGRFAPTLSLIIWLVVPPVLLYIYSRMMHPIFGPPRYTLFVGPAYLLLVARGVGRLPQPLAIATATIAASLAGVMLLHDVYRPDLKADWKAAAVYLNQRDPTAVVAIFSAGPSRTTELETARYYFGPRRVIMSWPDQLDDLALSSSSIWVSIGLRDGQPLGTLPNVLSTNELVGEVIDFSGLRLLRLDSHRLDLL